MKQKHNPLHHSLCRRGFLRGTLAGFAGLATHGAGATTLPIPGERQLAFYNIHTGEHLQTVYWANGAYVPSGLSDINHILRDFRTDTIVPMHRRLLDLLYLIHTRLDNPDPFHIISGYRTPATNAMLHDRSGQVASHSLHMDAMAVDIRLPGVALTHLRELALSLRAGGVGYYPRSDFVHVDIGRVRQWQGA